MVYELRDTDSTFEIRKIASYSKEKKPSEVFEIKDINIKEAIASKVNDTLYKANIK